MAAVPGSERHMPAIGDSAAASIDAHVAVPSDHFAARTDSIDALLAPFSVVCGTGSWIEAHLVAWLGHVQGIPNLQGCGITASEVVELCRRAPAPVLVFLTSSIAADHGIALCRQLKALVNTPSICFLIEQPSRLPADGSLQFDAIVNAASFGNGAVRDALLALSNGRSYRDPTLTCHAGPSETIALKPREQQVLDLLALGMTNKEIGSRLNIAAVTVRDYVQHLCQKFDAINRTEVVFKATCSGYLIPPSGMPDTSV